MKSVRRGAPLFVQMLALAVATLIAAHLVSTAVIFSLPPPPPEIYRLTDISRALKSPGLTPVGDGRPLLVKVRSKPPEERPLIRKARWRDDFRRMLAQQLQVQPEDIRIETQGPRRMFVQTMQAERIVALQVFRAPPPPPDGVGRGQTVELHLRKDRGAPDGPRGRVTMRRSDDRVIFAPFRVGVRQPDGRWLVAEPNPGFRLESWQGRILLTLLLSALAVAPLAWLFARRLAAPISAFAKAAERLGRDPRAPPLEIEGSREIAAAAEAFNQMQERLSRYVEDRTAMVGAIAHDLRTPLTRLRFRIEAVPDDIRAKLAADIDQMDAMIAAALGFVRDATRAGARERLELSSLVESVLDEAAETGADATALPSEKLVVDGDPLSLRRLVANLVENAVKYGARARGRVFAEGGCAVIEIEDDGPGVPPAEMERVFEPFYRREPSRSRETGGAGLGLAVVRSIARAHGGDVVLLNRRGGGLTARVSLPL
ncbi:ATP-binding protein [Caulobacter mirabilis]|uniref:histidine kinase n=1 Tax=Caulobacter mirabilis TaxID=69666 RepID=A0A2D2AXK6_9CAUL|nr:ATP-binding protein [Caulobacter mirabilis]ATQ42713.1 two-component sensor histidine kinase [Caulobacter mirabilis]